MRRLDSGCGAGYTALMLLLALSLAFAGPPVDADDPAAIAAEARRLVAEIQSHAADGKSAGVDREYRRLLTLGVRVDPAIHMLAADVARDQGDPMKAVARMYRVPAGSKEGPQVRAYHQAVSSGYAYLKVSLQPGAKVEVPSLFSPDEARAAQRLAKQVEETGVFIGLVPLGDYIIEGERVQLSTDPNGRPYAYSFPRPPNPNAPAGEMASSPPGQGAATVP